MRITVYTDGQDWLDAARDFLLRDEVPNALPYGIGERVARGTEYTDTAPFMAVITDGGAVVGAALMTPPHPLLIARGTAPAAFPALIDALRDNGWTFTTLISAQAEAEAFAAAWHTVTGGDHRIMKRQRIYRLAQVNAVRPTPGQMRLATEADIPQIAAWTGAFQQEATPGLPGAGKDQTPIARKRITAGDVFVWVVDGQIVSMSAKSRPTPSTITVNYVYTPPEHRRRGYATALVAAQSQHLLDSGYRYCTLFTDLDNPTSNAIYMQIGYEPVCDFRVLEFGG
jgi:predicted GNAT family acetyltransferase